MSSCIAFARGTLEYRNGSRDVPIIMLGGFIVLIQTLWNPFFPEHLVALLDLDISPLDLALSLL